MFCACSCATVSKKIAKIALPGRRYSGSCAAKVGGAPGSSAPNDGAASSGRHAETRRGPSSSRDIDLGVISISRRRPIRRPLCPSRRHPLLLNTTPAAEWSRFVARHGGDRDRLTAEPPAATAGSSGMRSRPVEPPFPKNLVPRTRARRVRTATWPPYPPIRAGPSRARAGGHGSFGVQAGGDEAQLKISKLSSPTRARFCRYRGPGHHDLGALRRTPPGYDNR